MASIGDYLAQSRRRAGLTQEAAAEAAGMHVRTLQRYEYGDQAVPDDVIWLMAKAYKDPGLCYRALQLNPIYKAVMPCYDPHETPTAALNLIARLNAMEDRATEIIEILSDGEIDATEKEDWKRIQEAIRNLIIAGMQVLEAGGLD